MLNDEVTIIRQINTGSLHVALRSDGIIASWPDMNWSGRVDLAQAKAYIAALQELSQDQRLPIITIMSNRGMTSEARRYFKEIRSVTKSQALVASSSFQRMVASMFLGMSKVDVPVKVFSDQQSALAWLKAQEG